MADTTTSPENLSSAESPVITASPEVESSDSHLVDLNDFAKLDLRVALIESVETLPKSKKLLKLQLDLGPLGKRQILSGIAQHYTPETLTGKKIVIIANLKPAKLMGEESQGMLLAASDEEDSIISILQPFVDVPPGSRVR